MNEIKELVMDCFKEYLEEENFATKEKIEKRCIGSNY